MENLMAEGKAIYKTVVAANDKAHTSLKMEFERFIAESIEHSLAAAVNKAVDQAVVKVVKLTSDKTPLSRGSGELSSRSALDLASQPDDAVPPIRSPRGATDIGQNGLRSA